jgi:arylsulfatase A-like enzyme
MKRAEAAKGKLAPSLTRREFIRNMSMAAGATAAAPLLGAEESPRRRTARPRSGSKLNLIYIGTDTWRADYLGCYGNPHIKTPYLDQLAKESVLLTNVYADGLPTIPHRRVLYTGRSILPFSKHGSWRPLFPEDVTLAQALQKTGYTKGLIVDCYHFFKPDMNLHRGFDSWEWVRGQENDMWQSGPKENFDVRKYLPEHLYELDRYKDGQNPRVLQYLLNTQDRRSEADYFCARTCRKAMQWLERNLNGKPFVLWLEMFDPHEPWDAPKRFQEMYYDKYPVERFLFGYGVDKTRLKPEDVTALKGLYSAEVTFSDLWIGRLLNRIRELGLMDNTIIIFSTDHGTHLGEQGCVQKTPGLLNSLVARLPLVIRHPDTGSFAGKRLDALISATDYMPTFLDLLRVKGPVERMTGKSFWPVVTGEKEAINDEVYTGFGSFGAVRTRQWHYFENLSTVVDPGSTPEEYDFRKAMTHPSRGKGPALYDLKNDRGETKNVVEEHPEVVAEMRGKLARRFEL